MRHPRPVGSSEAAWIEWTALATVGVGTYLMRAVFVIAVRLYPPALVSRALPLIGPAVLSAITLPMLAAPRGTVSLFDTTPALLAAAAVCVLRRQTKRLPLSLVGWTHLMAGAHGCGGSPHRRMTDPAVVDGSRTEDKCPVRVEHAHEPLALVDLLASFACVAAGFLPCHRQESVRRLQLRTRQKW